MVSVMPQGSLERCWKEYWKDPSAFWGTLSVEQALLTMEQEVLPRPSIQDLFSILFKCRKERTRSHTLRFHRYMQKSHMEAYSWLGNHIVATLVDVGSIHDAQQVFYGLEYRNDMSWHSLIVGYIKQGKPQLALSLHKKMCEKDVVNLTGRTFVALLKACLMVQELDRGYDIHAEVARLGLLAKDPFVGSTLVNLYTRCGSIIEAKEVFDKLENRDVVSWNTLITGYVNHGHAEEAFNCFNQMQNQGIHPNAVTFICGLKACAILGSMEKVTEIHAEAERKHLLERDHVLGSALVDMYAKCCYLNKAQEVFDTLPVRNVVSWTALISGYVDCDCGLAALISYEAMCNDGVHPNVITYTSLLKACGSIRSLVEGQGIHSEVARMSLLGSNLSLGNALIDMYMKCGLLRVAQEVFDTLICPDAFSWNVLMTGYVEQEQADEAFACFKQMGLKGVVPNAFTYVCFLKACMLIAAINRGQEVHLQIQKKGLLAEEEDPVVGNALVDMYAKCGLIAEADWLFDDLPFQNVVSWNAILTGLCEHLHGEEALELFKQMQKMGVPPDAVTFICGLKACGIIGAKDKGECLHTQIEKLGLWDRSLMIGNTLVDMYAKCGDLCVAEHVFNRLSFRHTGAWNALISGYADSGYGEKALEIYKQMQLESVPLDIVTLVSSLKACGSVGAFTKGKELHAEIARQGLLEQDRALGNTLVDMYAKCSLLAAAKETFTRLPTLDVVSWNVLIARYAAEGHSEEAFHYLEQMQNRGVSPDVYTFVSCLKACGCIGAVEKAQELHIAIEKRVLAETDFVGISLMDMYAKCGLLMDTECIFNTRPVQCVCHWNVLIAGYTDHGQNEKALDYCEQMQDKSIIPDSTTYFYCLKACGNIGASVKGAELHMEIMKKGLMEKDSVLGNTVLDMYLKCGLLGVAQHVFDKLPCKDTGSWNTLLSGYDELGQRDGIFDVFCTMVKEGEKPDAITFVIFLNACSHRGLFHEARKYLEGMRKDYNVIATLDHYTCVIDLLGRTGQLGEAITSLRESPCSPDLVMWRCLLGACKRWGDVELGNEAFQQALRWNLEDDVCIQPVL